jgi:uncharacterized protein (TIGR00369 family)
MPSHNKNKLSRYIAKISQAPKFAQSFLLTKLFCSQVKFANTTGIKIVKVTDNQVEIHLANKRKVQNHIGGVHAVAAAVLAESTTGLLLGLHVTDQCLPLLKSMNVNYQRRMQGDLKAVASLSEQQIEFIETQVKGDLIVPVTITDESGEQPIICEMHWAWIEKKRK